MLDNISMLYAIFYTLRIVHFRDSAISMQSPCCTCVSIDATTEKKKPEEEAKKAEEIGAFRPTTVT